MMDNFLKRVPRILSRTEGLVYYPACLGLGWKVDYFVSIRKFDFPDENYFIIDIRTA
jgi:hypothetical protein